MFRFSPVSLSISALMKKSALIIFGSSFAAGKARFSTPAAP
jgi:hypothetical protein